MSITQAILPGHAMLTVTLPADCDQESWYAAMDFVARYAVPGSEGTLVDHGTEQTWLFPAA